MSRNKTNMPSLAVAIVLIASLSVVLLLIEVGMTISSHSIEWTASLQNLHTMDPPSNPEDYTSMKIDLADPYILPSGVLLDPKRKYLLVAGWFGRFGNNINMMRNALVLSKLSNRTLLLKDKTSQGVDIAHLFQWDKVREIGYSVEFHPKYAKGYFPVEKWPRADDIHHLETFVDKYKRDPQQLILLHSYTAFYQCVSTEMDSELWKAMDPAPDYLGAVNTLKSRYLGLEPAERFVGVHLRKMEKECHRHVDKHFDHANFDNVDSMCNISWSMVEAAANLMGIKRIGDGVDAMKVVVASDGQDTVRDAKMQRFGARIVPWSEVPSNIVQLGPMVLDYFLMWDSYIFIGNSVSSFSSSVSESRVSRYEENMNILSLPPVYPEFSVDSFRKCHRFRFWCAKEALGKHNIC